MQFLAEEEEECKTHLKINVDRNLCDLDNFVQMARNGHVMNVCCFLSIKGFFCLPSTTSNRCPALHVESGTWFAPCTIHMQWQMQSDCVASDLF